MDPPFLLSRSFGVDNGLGRWNGHQRVPVRVLASDLPGMAWAVTALVRGAATVRILGPKNVRFVQIVTSGGPLVAIRAAHWERILPYIEDGTFSPALFPVEAGFKTFDPSVRLSGSTTEVRDPLYHRVLFYLSQLFTTQGD